jgi:hypothetical protein
MPAGVGTSHIQADGTHQIEGIARFDDPRLEAVIKNQFPALEAILEMGVGGAHT